MNSRDMGKLASIGLPRARAKSIRALARAVCTGRISFEGVVDSGDFLARLCEIPCIGKWTEQYVAMRALVEPGAFPSCDLGLWRKPDGLFVIQPEEIDTFLRPVPVGRLPGVGRVTGEKLAKLGIQTVGELRALDLSLLEHHFGRYGVRLHELAGGIDGSEVIPHRPTQSISVEDTFEHDVPLAELGPMIRRLAEKLWSASRQESRTARTVVLKLKTSEFKILTRSHTPGSPPSSCEELTDIALKLRERVDLGPQQRNRLVGVGLSNFQENERAAAQTALFE